METDGLHMVSAPEASREKLTIVHYHALLQSYPPDLAATALIADAYGELIPFDRETWAQAFHGHESVKLVFISDLEALLRAKGICQSFHALGEGNEYYSLAPQQILVHLFFGDTVVLAKPSGDQSFSRLLSSFQELHPEWKQPTALYFWSSSAYQHHNMDDFLVRSHQRRKQSPCFMHATVVLQHYLVVKGSGRANHQQLNMAAFCRLYLQGKDFREYLNGDGGSALWFLKLITNSPDIQTLISTLPNKHRHPEKAAWHMTEIRTNLEAYGPALVYGFVVDAQFMDCPGVTFFDTRVDMKTKRGTHAMLLISIRPDSTHGHIFLLQNWWRGRELIRVSEDYLCAAHASICFITDPILSIPDAFPSVEAFLSESCADVGGDCAPRDGYSCIS